LTQKPLYSFMHIQKAGGTTMESILRRHFGLRHLDAAPRRGWLYTHQDLRADLRLNPLVRSISGHWLRPFIDYGEHARRMVWFTMLRHPVKRFISQYQHLTDHGGMRQSLDDFLERPRTWNFQVRFLTGDQDLERAKAILSGFRSVGLLERFDESMVLLRDHLGLPEMNVAYTHKNAARSSELRQRVAEEVERLRDRVEEKNALDLELYAHAQAIFSEQVETYGAERLAADVAEAMAQPVGGFRESFNERTNNLLRKGAYRPLVKARGMIARMRGVPEVRT